MALNSYLRLTGKVQGPIKGSVVQKGREGTIEVFAATHQVDTPRDVASGMASGKRKHSPFTIWKVLDQATPRLYSALIKNEPMSLWELQFFRADKSGKETNHYTVRLTDASVASIRFDQPTTRDPDQASLLEYEQVTFTYSAIEWIWTSGGLTATDSWSGKGP